MHLNFPMSCLVVRRAPKRARRAVGRAAESSNRGFTLLELVLALAVMGVVVLIALGAFRVGQRSWERGDALADANQRLRIAAERIRQQLSAATLYLSSDEGTFAGFSGDADEIHFVSRVSLVPKKEQGLVFVRYRFVETDHQGLTLFFYEQPVVALNTSPSNEADDQADFHPLIAGLADAAWEYRARSTDGMNASWTDHWNGAENSGLPVAVRLLVRTGQHPPLAVVVRVADPTGG